MAFKFTELDTGSTLEVTCKNEADSVIIDLTGFTEVLLRYKVGTSAMQEKTMTIDGVPTTGKATYKFLTGELLAGGGQLTAEVKLTDSGGFTLRSIENLELPVKAILSA